MIGDVGERKPGMEADLLQTLRRDYEARGFSFEAEPGTDGLPPFLGGFRPDAVARAPGQNVAVFVKRRHGSSQDGRIADVQRLLSDKPDWSFRVVVPGSDPLDSVVIRDADPAAVEEQRRAVLDLCLQGHRRAAFLMAWAVLEAAFRAGADGAHGRAQGVTALVEALATIGRIEPETGRGLRALIGLRNRVAHGDLSAEPDAEDVEAVLSAAAEAMRDLAA